MPRRLKSESFFYLNVRSRFNQKTRAQIPASNMNSAYAMSRSVGTLLRTLATLIAMSSIISEAAAQTQPQTSTTTPNVTPPVQVTSAPSAPASPPKPGPTAPAAAPKPTVAPSAPAATSTPVATGVTTTAAPPAPPAAPPAAPAPAPSVSPEQQAAAAAALTAGQEAFAKGDYLAAEQQYRIAMAAVPSAQAQLGMASSLDLQAKPTEAFDAYTELLARTDIDQLPAAETTRARERRDVLAQIPAVVRLAVVSKEQLVSGAKILMDGAEQTSAEMRLTAGSHQLRVLATGYQDHESTLTVKPAQVIDLPVELQAVPAPPVAATPAEVAVQAPTAPAEETEPASKVPAYVTLGVAGGAAIAGAIFGIKALSAEDRFDKSPTVSHADDVERNALIADMAFGVAFTLGITGIVLLVTDEPTEPGASTETQTALQIVPYVSPERGGAVARLTF